MSSKEGAGQPILAHIHSAPELWWLRLKALCFMVLSQVVMCLTGVIGVLAHLFTFGRARRFCLNTLGPAGARFLLWTIGIRVVFVGFEDVPEPCIVVGNHPSGLDILIITLMPVSNLRSFLSRWLKVYLPLGLNGWCNGTIFTPPQRFPEARVRCFQDAEARLRASGDSCFLSVEGRRWTGPGVGPFNKGALHLATALQWPIVPIYIDIPDRISPGVGFLTRPGTVHVYARPPIDTTEWRVEDALQHKDELYQVYMAFPAGWTDA
jgi:1-acyl-sn-glycerol-3-phosphate acyltransferase